jgi:hypothetical protein
MHSDFDPMKEVDWPLVQAVSWICWRDPLLVMELDPKYCRRCTQWAESNWHDSGKAHIHTGWILEPWRSYSTNGLRFLESSLSQCSRLPSNAKSAHESIENLRRALTNDQLRAEAFDRTGKLVEVPPREWSRLEIFEEDGKDVLKYEPLDIPAFTDVRLKRLDVTSIWQRSQFVRVGVDALELGDLSDQDFGLMLAEEAYVPFCVAICWLATKGGLKAVPKRDVHEWTRAAKSLLARISSGQVQIIGCGDSSVSETLPPAAFDSIDCPHPHSIEVRCILSKETHVHCKFFTSDEDWKGGFDDQFFLEGKLRPHWRRLRVRRSQVLEFFPKPPPTANLESECFKWLKELMGIHKYRPKLKSNLLDEARAQFRGLSINQSERAWTRAIKESPPEWRRRGPIRKV